MIILALLGMVLANGQEVVDRIVADVDGQLVLMSDVAREAVLAEVDRSGTPFWDPTWRTPEDRLIDAAIVRTIASDVRLYEPSRQDVRRRLEAVRAQFPDRRSWRAFLDRISADEARLEVILRRRLVVDRYLGRNLLVDPGNADAFKDAATLHLDRLRTIARVRRVPPVPSSTP
ncbi:MAG: hypothetical protein AAGA48_20490 [Myxococcota bacterium]